MSSIPGSGRPPREGNGNPTPVFLLGKSHGQRSLTGYSPLGHKESDMIEHTHTFVAHNLYNIEQQLCRSCCCCVASVVLDSVRPHRRPTTRLLRPWDSPGKNTGVGCHFRLLSLQVKSESEVAQSCPTCSDPMDCSPPGSSVHGIFQARVLEWGAIAFSKQQLYYNTKCA